MRSRDGLLLQLAWGVLADLDLELVLQRALEAAKELTGARYAALGVLDEDGAELARFLTMGIDAETQREIGPHPRGRGVLGELIRHPTPLRLDDVESHPHAYGFPPAHPPMHTFLGMPIVVAGRPFGEIYLTEKEGGSSFTDADEDAIALIAEFTAVAIGHTRRFQALAGEERALRRSVEALDATVTISRSLAAQTDLDVILDLVAKRGRALVSARALVIELVEGDHLRVAAAAGEIDAAVRGIAVPVADSVAAATLRTGRPQRLDGEIDEAVLLRNGLKAPESGFRAGLAVPLVLRGTTYGALIALDREVDGPLFGERDEELLEAFAASAAAAVATARSVDDQRRRARLAAAEAERGRWARELHDDTLRGLVELRDTLLAIEAAEVEEAARLSQLGVPRVEGEIAKLRGLINELRPPALDRGGIAAGIEALVRDAADAGMEVVTRIDLAYEAGREDRRHVYELETAVYRIVQEGLRNASAHARGAPVRIEVVDDEKTGDLVVRVEDDGPGFDPAPGHDGFGLQSIRERVELLGGVLEVGSSPDGGGTEVAVRLPGERRDASSGSAGPASLSPA